MPEELVTSPNELPAVKSRAVKGMVTLTGGGLVLTLISGLGVLLLTTFLGPEEFGIYALVASIIVVLGYFSDIGLAASLIQKKGEITTQDLRTSFTIQQILVITVILITLIFSPQIRDYYNFSTAQNYLFFSLLLSFFLSSLKSIPSVMLERELRFDRIMLVRIFETISFNGLAVILAMAGFGVMSYVPAVIVQGSVGLLLIYLFRPWPVGIAFSRDSLKKLLKFGIPYQTNSLLAVAKDQFVNLFLYKLIGSAGMGFVNWGFYYSQFPQRLIMDNVTRVAFPALSRMQDHPEEFRRSVERMLKFACLAIFPTLIGIGLFWSHMALIVPKWFKWQPALLPLYLFCFSAILSCLSTPLTNTLYALGKAKINTALMVMWLILEWTFKPLMAAKFGFVGIAYAAAIIALSSFVPFLIARKIIGFKVVNALGSVTLATLAMLAIGLATHNWGVLANLICSTLAYVATLIFFEGKKLITEIRPFYAYFRAKI